MMEEKKFEQFNPEIRLAQEKDLAGISQLQDENLSKNISLEEKLNEGFVVVKTPPDLLKEIAVQEGITIAQLDKKIIGYLIPMSVEHGQKISFWNPFIKKIKTIQLEGKPLDDYQYCILSQVCIDKNHRGKGILEKLYKDLEERLADKYDFGISEIETNNQRSLQAHLNKIGLKIVEKYSVEGKDWYIVILDFLPFRKNNLQNKKT